MLRKIGVIGAGTMGHGIAETFALHGFQVNLWDIDDAALRRGMEAIEEELELLAEEKIIEPGDIPAILARIKTFTSVPDAVRDRDYVIEAAPENIALKQKLFRQMDEVCPAETIFASNTSSLSLEPMMELVSAARKKRMMVCHWYNPAHLMPLVELSFFGNMPSDIYGQVADLYAKIGKQTAKILKDVPGLAANRIQQGVAREVFSLIEQGIAEPEDVDKALKFGPAFRYATTGQLEVADFGGLDIWCIVGDNLLKVMDASKEANPALRRKVEQGKLGLKSGEGFFAYDPAKVPAIKKHFYRKLIHQLKASDFYVER